MVILQPVYNNSLLAGFPHFEDSLEQATTTSTRYPTV